MSDEESFGDSDPEDAVDAADEEEPTEEDAEDE